MDKEKRCALFAIYLEKELAKLSEQDASKRIWRTVDTLKLPRQCFLWTEDPEKRNTWHLPYREGAGGIDPATGFYEKAGPVNLGALRAIASAIEKSGDGGSLSIPSLIKSKITKLLKRYKIGKFKEQAGMKKTAREIIETSFAQQFAQAQLDKESMIVKNVAILRPTSVNKMFKESTGREYSENALAQAAEMSEGMKSYSNHAIDEDLKKRHGVRPVEELVGFYSNTRLAEGGVVRGDFHYLPHRAAMVESLVEKMSDKIGNSIHAFGDVVFDKTRKLEVVESLDRMASIDLVTEPGSTRNLLEADLEDDEEIIEVIEEETMEIKDLTLKELREGRPDLIEKIAGEVKADADLSMKIVTLEEANAKLAEDNAEYKKKLDDAAVIEAARAKETKIKELIAEAKLPDEAVTDPFMESLRGAKDGESIKALVEDRKALLSTATDGVKDMGDEKDKDKVTESAAKSKDVDDATLVAAVKEARHNG